jgi:hypothetical protein
LSEALTVAEAELGRPLLQDEVLMVARLLEGGGTAEKLFQLLAEFDRPVVQDDEMPTHRYEPQGDGVRLI